jgi:DNA-binding NtrC family response regulator
MKLLYVEDLELDQRAVTKVLQAAGHSVDVYENAEMASAITDDKLHTYDVAVIDHQLPGENGLELGKRLIYRNPQLFLIMLTAYTDAEKKLAAQYGGFVAFVAKPNTNEVVEMLNALKPRVQERRKLFLDLNENAYGIVGSSEQMRNVRQLIARIAPTEASVLVLGESGTGKELVAKAVHYASNRSSKNIVCINCAAIPESLLESELFGHERGAFTGATVKKDGRVKTADEGTLFLDEIAEMSKDLQAKLLRFLQDGSFTPVGGTKELRVDVRLVTATNKNIRQAMAAGKFREDLFYRIQTIELNLPPLREREQDIFVLAEHFLNTFSKANSKLITGFSEAAKGKLASHQWPGNVRELENAIQRAVILENTNTILPSSLPDFNVTTHSTTVNQPKTSTSIAVSVDPKELYWQSLIKVRLDELEAAFPQALVISQTGRTNNQKSGKDRVRLEDLGKALNPPCSHVVLSNFFNDRNSWRDIPGPTRLNIIKSLAKMHPDHWPHLRNDCGRLKKHFQ